MRTKTKTEYVQHTRTTLTGKDILRLLKGSHRVKINKETKVLFTIPTGGDYSGMTLDLCELDAPAIVVTSKSYDLCHVKKEKK